MKHFSTDNRLHKKDSDLGKTTVVWVGLVLIILSVFIQVRRHEFISYDDIDYVTENSYVQKGLTPESITWAFSARYASNWHPLTWLSHMLDCQLYGLNSGMHHLTNVFFHLVNTLLLFLVFKIMTGALWKSAFVAALFAVHPLHVESVAWVAERKDVLSTFFWLLTMLAYVRYTQKPNLKKYSLTLFCFLMGLMSKPMVVTLPFVLFLMDFWPLQRFQNTRPVLQRLIMEKIPLLVLAGASCIMTYLVQGSGGAMSSIEILPFTARAANALNSYALYAIKMIWPTQLAVFYPHPRIFSEWQVIGSCLFLSAVSWMTIFFHKRYPFLITGWLWYLGTLVPVIGLVQVGGQAMADRYTYIPLIGLFMMVAWIVPEISDKKKTGILAAGAVALIFILSVISFYQTRHWQNDISLFGHALHVTKNNHTMHNNLGLTLSHKGNLDQAIAHYQKALQINPEYSHAHSNLGLALARSNRHEKAIFHCRKAIQINPNMSVAYSTMGISCVKLGRLSEAITFFETALQINPGNAIDYSNLAGALLISGLYDDAIRNYRKAMEIDPQLSGIKRSLSNALKLKAQDARGNKK